MSAADEFKQKGNAALQAGNLSEAIEQYTKAINADGSNHVFYSNRSAAYLKKGDPNNALEDAESCINLNPDFPKGYSRKGAALHAMKRYNDSIAAYEDGLKKFPTEAGLTKGLQDVKNEKENPFPGAGSAPGGGGGGLFSPAMMAQMALDPRMRPYLNDQEMMAKIKLVQQNPNLLTTMLSDPKMMEFLSLMMGRGENDEDDASTPSSSPTPAPAASTSSKKEPEPEPMEAEEDWSDLPPEEREKKEKQKAANEKKMKGNEHYKKKEFAEALAAYDEAIAIDPTNMTYISNKAAVFFTQKKYEECIKTCEEAVEVGKSNRAPFEDRAKALARAAKAYQKMGNLEKAIEMCNAAQVENYDKAVQRMLKTLELEKKKADTLSYQDDAEAEEAKQRGNELFRAQKWGEAVREYEDAVKRAPNNAIIRNNLSAALCKVMDFSSAKREVEKALEIDPKFVKAWARKGDIEIVMKELHKAKDSYAKGLEIDPSNPVCLQGLQKVHQMINYGRQNMTEEQKKEQAAHAMADPEIQSILQDPVMQQVLRDFSENQSAAQEAMRDATVRSKIEKLIAAGIIETR